MIIRTANKHKDPATGNQVDGFSDEPNAMLRGQPGYDLEKVDEGIWVVTWEREVRDAQGVLLVETTTLRLSDVIEEREVAVQAKKALVKKAAPKAKLEEVVS